MPRLRLLGPPLPGLPAGAEVVVTARGARIGSAPDNDIVLLHLSVAPYHAHLMLSGGRYGLVSRDAAAQIIINGQPVVQAELPPASLVRIGAVELEWALEEDAAAPRVGPTGTVAIPQMALPQAAPPPASPAQGAPAPYVPPAQPMAYPAQGQAYSPHVQPATHAMQTPRAQSSRKKSGAGLWILLALLFVVAFLGLGGTAHWLVFRDAQPNKPPTSGEVAIGTRPDVSEAPAPDAGSKELGKLELNDAVSRKVEASPAPQVVDFPGNIRVTLPGGSVKQADLLSVARVKAPPKSAVSALVGGDAYDISLGKQSEFDAELSIELPIDTARLASSPRRILFGAYFDERQGVWQLLPAEADAQGERAVIRTRHLSAWRLFYLARGFGVRESDHFSVVYDEASYPVVGKRQEEPAAFALRVTSYLEAARTKYRSAGFRAPGSRTWAFVESKRFESERGVITGYIHFTGTFDSVDELRHEVAHELFHAVQNQYMNLYSMAARRFWMEATADYAADQVAFGGTGMMGRGMAPSFLAKPLTTTDGKHEYQLSHFIAHLVSKGASFRSLWDATTSKTSTMVTGVSLATGSDLHVLGPLGNSVYSQTKTLLADHFQEYAQKLLFDTASPFGAAPTNACAKRADLKASEASATTSLHLQPVHTALVWCVTAASTDDKPRQLDLEVTSALESGVSVHAFVLPRREREAGAKPKGRIFELQKPLSLELSPSDGLFVLVTNGDQRSARTVGLAVTDISAQVSIEPKQVQSLATGVPLELVAKIEKLTPRTTEIAYEWAFGDGSEVVSDSQKTGGNASIEVKREHGFEKNGDYTVTFQAFDVTRSPKRKLGEAQARVRVESFALAIEHQPTEVEEGKPVTFTAKLTSGTLPTDGRFAWDFGDGASSPPGSAASVQHAYGKHTKSHKVTVTLTSASDPSRILARAERTVVVGMNCETACAGEMEGSLDCIVCRHVPDPDQKVVRQPHDVVQEP